MRLIMEYATITQVAGLSLFASEGVDQHSVSDCFLTFSLGRFTLFLSYLFQHIQSLLTLCKEGLRLEAVVQW